MGFTKEQLQEMAGSVPFWFHSIDLGQGVVTKGWKSKDRLEDEFRSCRLGDLRGKSVLDINAWDGFFSFAAERAGADRVAALDKYMWSLATDKWLKYWLECRENNISPVRFQESPYWQPETLPGKSGFDSARRALNSRVEDMVDDLMEMNVTRLGTFDVVLYLGSLYHMLHPMEALLRVAAVTGEVAVIETEAIELPGLEDHAFCEFFPTNELLGDSSNWWAPNIKACVGMCHAAGFSRVEVLNRPPASRESFKAKLRSSVGYALREFSIKKGPSGKVVRYRAMLKAWK